MGHNHVNFIRGNKTASMKIRAVPARYDNYMYLIIDSKSKKAACVDPYNMKRINTALKEEGVDLVCCFTTHSHYDHNGGNRDLRKQYKDVPIYTGYSDDITTKLAQDDIIKVGNLSVRALSTPCHTSDHLCYYIDPEDGSSPAVFTGDTMFVGGCGNFNSGTPEQMHKAMIKILGELPGNTLVYVGHEYTVRNLKFGLYAEPNNADIQNKLEWAKDQRKQNIPTVPSTIADEWKTNPFMRVQEDVIKKFTKEEDPVNVIFAVRKMKDRWGRTH